MKRRTEFKLISYTDSSAKDASAGAEDLLNEWAKDIQENPPKVEGDQPVKSVVIVSATLSHMATQPHVMQSDITVQSGQLLYTMTILVQYELHFGHIKM